MVEPHVEAFYKLLPRLGIDGGAQHPLEAERTLASVKELKGYPLEWMAKGGPLEKTCIDKGVMNIPTVIKYMRYSHTHNIPPGERPADKQVDDRSDELIDRTERRKWGDWQHADYERLPNHAQAEYDRLKERYGAS